MTQIVRVIPILDHLIFFRHSIIGQSDLRITEDGYIWTTVDNSFDYERQPVVYVQLRAMDTMQINGRNELHTAYAQLQINLIDVNDKSPELRMV